MAMITILLESKTRVKHMGRNDQRYDNVINELTRGREEWKKPREGYLEKHKESCLDRIRRCWPNSSNALARIPTT
jgi:hypothetical protein